MSNIIQTVQKDQIRVFVLLPVHNRKALTLKFLDSLRGQSHNNLVLILIDDGSSDSTAAAVRAVWPSTVVITGHGDWWWAGSLFQGMQWLRKHDVATDDLVLIANDDTVLECEFIQRAVEFMIEHPRTLLLARQRNDPNLPAEETGIYFNLGIWRHRIARYSDEINCLATRCLFIRWEDMQAVGNFRPRLLPHYFSDYEYTLRAHRLGFTLTTHPDIAVSANMETTGFHSFNDLTKYGELKKLFSKKSAANPIFATIFALLVSPPRYMAINVLRIWWRGLLRILAGRWAMMQ